MQKHSSFFSPSFFPLIILAAELSPWNLREKKLQFPHKEKLSEWINYAN